MNNRKYKIAVLNTHPIQYFAPLYRHLSTLEEIDLTVFYTSNKGIKSYYDTGFKKEIQWDIDLTEGYNFYFLNKKNQFHIFFKSSILYKIGRNLLKDKYDVLILHGTGSIYNIFALFICKILKIKVFMRRDTHIKSSSKQGWLKSKALRFLSRMVDVNLSISQKHDEYYIHNGISESSIRRVPFTVDNHFFIKGSQLSNEHKEKVKKDLGIKEGQVIILYASKLLKQKRPSDLLKAVREINDKRIVLLYVGTGEEEEKLINYTKQYNMEQVKFLGFKNQTEIPMFYAVSDIFVLPSDKEAWGLVINEAMCAGLPIITTNDVGAVPEIVKHGKTGLIYDASNVDELVAHLKLLVNNDDLRKELGQNSFELISTYDNHLFSKRLLEILDDVIGGI